MFFLLSACGEELTVEQQIIASLETMEADAEEGRTLDFMRHVAKGFEGQKGSMDRADFQRYMLLQFNENRRMYANFFPITVVGTPELAGEPKATASFRLLITGGNGILPDRGRLFEVQTAWVKEGGKWLLLAAEWETVQITE
jgi:hypothetical protein